MMLIMSSVVCKDLVVSFTTIWSLPSIGLDQGSQKGDMKHSYPTAQTA